MEEESETLDDDDESATAQYCKIQICLAKRDVQQIIVQAMVAEGAVLKAGAPPMSPKAREVKKLMKKLRNSS